MVLRRPGYSPGSWDPQTLSCHAGEQAWRSVHLLAVCAQHVVGKLKSETAPDSGSPELVKEEGELGA